MISPTPNHAASSARPWKRRSASRSREARHRHDDEDRDVVVAGGLRLNPRDRERADADRRDHGDAVGALELRADERGGGREERPPEEQVRGDEPEDLRGPQGPDGSHQREHRPEQQLELRARAEIRPGVHLGLDVVALVGEVQAPVDGREQHDDPDEHDAGDDHARDDRQLVGDADSRSDPRAFRRDLRRPDSRARPPRAQSLRREVPSGDRLPLLTIDRLSSTMTDTNSVRLRAVELDDLAFTRRCRNDPSVHIPALGRRFPITEVGEEAWFRSLGQGSPPAEVTVHRRRV